MKYPIVISVEKVSTGFILWVRGRQVNTYSRRGLQLAIDEAERISGILEDLDQFECKIEIGVVRKKK